MDRGTNVKLIVDFLSEAMQTRRQWPNILRLLKEKLPARTKFSEKSFRNKGGIRTLLDIPKAETVHHPQTH